MTIKGLKNMIHRKWYAKFVRNRKHLVLDVSYGRYKCIGKDLIIFYRYTEPPESWFDATTVSIAKGNNISLTKAFRVSSR